MKKLLFINEKNMTTTIVDDKDKAGPGDDSAGPKKVIKYLRAYGANNVGH